MVRPVLSNHRMDLALSGSPDVASACLLGLARLQRTPIVLGVSIDDAKPQQTFKPRSRPRQQHGIPTQKSGNERLDLHLVAARGNHDGCNH